MAANNSYVERARKSLIRRAPHFEPASVAQKDVFLRRRREGLTAGEARKKAELSWAQFKHAMASDPEFMQAIEEIEEFFLDKLEEVASSMANARDGPMVRWILEKRRPEKYGQRSKVEVSHRFQGPEDIRKLSDEDLMAEFELLGIEVKP